MDPIFDSKGRARGWMYNDVIFDQAGRPRAFVKGEGVFSFRGLFLGFFRRGYVRDTSGHAVAFLRGARGTPVPPPPLVPPVAPQRGQVPLKPQVSSASSSPNGAPDWSRLDWDAFLG